MSRPLVPLLAQALLSLLACSGGDDATPDALDADPLFPADYSTTYTEVRSCRQNADHDLHLIRILADPAALVPYRDRSALFPDGAVVLKEEHDFGDTDCSGEIILWTVIARLPLGSSNDTLDWRWQKVAPDRRVMTQDELRCIDCHSMCTPPDGYENTCSIP